MSRKIWSFILTVILTCTMTLPAFAEDQPAAGSTADTVTIYTTNDIHGIVANSDTAIGLAQAAGIAASTENALLVDAGDATQGASFATITQGADVIRMMNAAGYDVMAAGNHEFDYGAEQLLANAELAEFPILSANVKQNGEAMLYPYTIVKAGGHRIGFIGLTTADTATSTNPAKLTGVTFEGEIDAAKAQIEAIKDQTDAIVLVCHMGDNAAAVQVTSEDLLAGLTPAELAEVTAVIDGHSHSDENKTYADTGIPVIQTKTGFTKLGKIVLTFDGDQVTAAGEVLDYDAAMAVSLTKEGEAAKEKVEKLLEEITAEQEEVLGKKLCENLSPVWGGNIYWDYSESRIVETAYGDFVTDAFASYAAEFAKQQKLDWPVVAVENGGGISAPMPAGTVTRGDILNAFNHGNMVDVLQVTPAQLYTALEVGLTATGQGEDGLLLRERVSGSFLQVSGFTYAYDPAGETGSKVTAVTLPDGTELKRTDTTTKLLLATNSYVAGFDGIAEGEKLGELGGEDQIVEEYLLSQTENGTKPLSVPVTADRILIANDQSPETYSVVIPVKDAEGKTTAVGKTVHILSEEGEIETVIEEDGVHLTLQKGPHTIYLEECADRVPVYVNNYSGSGTVTTADGYYHLYFVVDETLLGTKNVSETTMADAADSAMDEIEKMEGLTEEEKTAYQESVSILLSEVLFTLREATTEEEINTIMKDFETALQSLLANIPEKEPETPGEETTKPAETKDPEKETEQPTSDQQASEEPTTGGKTPGAGSPTTGDQNNLGWLLLLLAVSGAAVVPLAAKKKAE